MSNASTEQQDSVVKFCRDFSEELTLRGTSLRNAAALTHWSKSAIGKARTGPGLPNPALVVDVLTAIGVDSARVQDWSLRHAALAMSLTRPPTADVEANPSPEQPVAPVAARPSRRRGIALLALLVVAVAAIATGVTYLVMSPTAASPPLPAVSAAVVTVQNMVALGPDELVEDSTSASLSTRTVPSCSRNGCKIDGTDVASGALLPAICTTHGSKMWNYNLDSPAAANPHRASSDLWYRIVWPDGRSGYLAEVYLVPDSRGGLGLPDCATVDGRTG